MQHSDDRDLPFGPEEAEELRKMGQPGPQPGDAKRAADADEPADVHEPEPITDPTVSDARLRAILEDQGFHTIHTAARNALAAIGQLPLETLEAALVYHDGAVARLEASPDPQIREAGRQSRAQGRFLVLARRFRRELEQEEQRAAASARIVAP